MRDSLASLEAIRSNLGYEPQVDLRERLRDAWSWYGEAAAPGTGR